MNPKRIAWAITGAGHALEESVGILVSQPSVDVFLSRAAEEVLGIYHLEARIQRPDIRVYRDIRSSAPLVSRLYDGSYRVLVIAPATSNSVAKFVCGISDTLITNLFAQAGKSQVPILVYPTDLAPQIDSCGPHGESLKVFPRPVDLENTEKLRTFPGVRVVSSCEELEQGLIAHLLLS